VRFALLGPLSVHDGSGPIPVAGRLRRTLLAALLLEAGTPVSTDRLADLLWGAAADNAPLHVQVMRLRHALGDEERVRAVPPGYQIDVAPGELDLHVFAEEYAAGRRELADGAWAEASRRFAAALELWRGRPLNDILALADHMRVRELEETYVQARQGRIEAGLHLGRHHELTEELSALIHEYPRNETFHRQLILALHRAGRSKEAADVYAGYETSLRDEVGLEPSAELHELRAAVVRDDPALALPPNPHAPRQLPADTRLFTGRDEQLAELLAAAGESSGTLVISALDGLGGIGKTTLAVRAAHRVAERFPDGQLFIDLRGHAAVGAALPAEEALAYLLRSLGVPGQAIPDTTAERAALYRSRLEDSRTLIVLDNAAGEEQLRPLLPGEPGCLVLITSRRRLTLDRARSITVELLSERDSVNLLAEVAGRHRLAEDSAAAADLARLCGYIPLALRIVGARLRHGDGLTAEELVRELRRSDSRLDEFTDGERDLTSVFDASFASLGEAERRALRLLGTIPGTDFDAYAAANLLDTTLEAAEALLSSLLTHSLLIQQVEGRYAMHDLVRTYARTLPDTDDAQAGRARDRLLDYYRYAAWTAARHQTTVIRWREPAADFRGPSPALDEMVRAMNWLRTERANLLAAVHDGAVSTERRIDLAIALAALLQLDGPWPEATALQRMAERMAAEAGDRHGRADALRNLGQLLVLASREGSYVEALECYAQARELYREVGNRSGEADALFRYGRAQTFLNEFEAAVASSREARTLFQQARDRTGEALALQAIGDAARQLGRNIEALEACRETLAIHRELGNRQGEGVSLQKLGYVLSEIGEFDEALEYLELALENNRSYGQRVGEGSVLNVMGGIYSARGAYQKADETMRRALELFEELSYPLGTGVMRMHLGQNKVDAGEPLAGIGYLEQAHAGFTEHGNQYGEVEAARKLGFARILAGDPEGRDLIRRSLEAYRGTVADPPGEIEALVQLGRADLLRGEPRAALGSFEQALPLARRIHGAVAEARALDGLAQCHVALGEPAAALEPLREAVGRYRRMGLAELAGAEERLATLGGSGPV
jgi:DNA-binding SARP family transcriptional activator